jgi:hypothetical protein
MTTPDGHFAYQKALRAESIALREYGRVLKVFHDLTVNGIIPNEDEWQKRRAAGRRNRLTLSNEIMPKPNKKIT